MNVHPKTGAIPEEILNHIGQILHCNYNFGDVVPFEQVENMLTLLLLVMLLHPILLLGQPGDPGGDPDVPISGIEILIGLGALLGIKRLYGARKKDA
jgi:hypothetical protein